MRPWGRIRRRLALAIVLTALLPVLVAIALVEITVRQTSARFFVPEIGQHLDQSLELYQELADAIKNSMRSRASAIAVNPALREAVRQGDPEAVRQWLERYLELFPDTVSLEVVAADGKSLAAVDRGTPVDPAREKHLTVRRSLVDERPEEELDEPPGEPVTEPDPSAADGPLPTDGPLTSDGGAELVAVFVTERARFDEHHEMSRFVDTYRRIERRREQDEQSYVFAFATLLGITILAAIAMGVFLARGVSRRIDELAAATRQVGAGDLRVRVGEEGSDELADLARAFNRMLAEVESSRARIEYLQHIGAWQEMARRLAHEIKNPLTPIQLAVQEAERRYTGGDEAFTQLLQTTREIVEDEVATLRRLVSEFSGFARLPRAELESGDLAELLRQQALRSRLGSEDADTTTGEVQILPSHVRFELDVPERSAPAHLDRQMLGRVISNLVRNAVEALSSAVAAGSDPRAGATGRIALRLSRSGDYWVIDVDDDGPGIEPERRAAVFDPYVTSKPDGTGLGLAIVKKIVVEHGGVVSAEESAWGGARIRVRLPVAGTPSAEAALEASRCEPQPASQGRPASPRRSESYESSLS